MVISHMVHTADTAIEHPLVHMLAAAIAFVAVVYTRKIEHGRCAEIPPGGFHQPVVLTRDVFIPVMTGLIGRISPGIRLKELHFQGQPGHEPLTEADAPVGRDRPLEGSQVGIIAPERVGTARSEDKPVLAERVGDHPIGIHQRVFLQQDIIQRIHRHRVAIDFPIVLVLVIDLRLHR